MPGRDRDVDRWRPGAKGADRPTLGTMPTALLLGLILVAGGVLRFAGTDWDAGQHVHPDERFLTMVGSALAMPDGITAYLTTDTSPLNPRNRGYGFFAYGTWPVTLVYLAAHASDRTGYDQIHLVGRRVSAALDLLSVLLVFGIGVRVYDRRVALVASALTAFTVLHVQQAHFFTVDAALTCFVLLALFGLAGDLRAGRRAWLDLTVAGAGLGMALASKVSVWLLVPVSMAVIVVAEARRRASAGRHVPVLESLATVGLKIEFLGVVALVVLRLAAPDMFAGAGWSRVIGHPERFEEVTTGAFPAPAWWFTIRDRMPDRLEPYLLPDPRWAHSVETIRAQVTGFGMDWPPNHQWWGRAGYWFPWRNMVLWGMGIPLGLAVTLAWLMAAAAIVRGERRHLLLWLWVLAFVAFNGLQWAKTLRYFLPVYPALTLLAAWMLVRWLERSGATPHGPRLRARAPAVAAAVIVIGGTVAWGVMFSRIYGRDHSQVQASRWIYHNLPTAFGVRVTIDDGEGAALPGPWLPAHPPPALPFRDGRYRIENDAWVGPMRVVVGSAAAAAEGAPGIRAIRVDGARLAYVRGEGAAPTAPARVQAALTSGPSPPAAGETLAHGERLAAPSEREETIVVDFASPAALVPGHEYQLWVRVAGATLTGRPATLAIETGWDLPLPLGIARYAAFDDPATPAAEGLFAYERFEMFSDETPEWFEQTLQSIDRVDYWVSPTNRVYDAIRQIPTRFPVALALYDRVLFAEQYGFRLALDAHSFPGVGPIRIDDQGAEEAFHVYDHPRVLVFARTTDYDADTIRRFLSPFGERRCWRFPAESDRRLGRFLDALLGRTPVERAVIDWRPGPTCGLLGDLAGRPVGAPDAAYAALDAGCRAVFPPRGGDRHLCRTIDAWLNAER